jgi:DNA-binding beta-propeller fold protein YncE
MLQQLPPVNAPEFPADLEWLNTKRPLTIRELRGKVVLLDFWTYCCINCMHVIPDLRRLEEKYGDALVVIGVHSAKFTTEKATENIRQAILRYGVEHPVVNDRDFEVWESYTVNAWPTIVLVDPRGKVVAQRSGEGVFDAFDAAIGKLVAEATASGTLDVKPLDLTPERGEARNAPLSFPGKVLADAASKRLFVADSNHNRIVVASLDGKVQEVVGSGRRGLDDGDFAKATFANPQGLALDGETLYVADTSNHAIRRVDLAARTVETIAGTGEQARRREIAGGARSVSLASPWDLVARDGSLYVAMAGSHQIWRLDLAKNWIEPFAGSGLENRIDGPRAEAALAQPSGLAVNGSRLFVADSEVSAIRSIDLGPRGAVATIVGRALFAFGDEDGTGDAVRLQHPLGVAYAAGSLYVADTYNNKIKRIDPDAKSSRTFAGTGESGRADGAPAEARFDEPGGLSIAGKTVYVADTNNDAVRTIDLETGRVATLELRGLEPPAPPRAERPYSGETIDVAEQTSAPGGGTLVFDLRFSEGLESSEEAPYYFGLSSSDGAVVAVAPDASGTLVAPELPRRFAVEAKNGTATLTLDTAIYYCRKGAKSLCFIKQVRFKVPVRVAAGASRDLRVGYTVSAD